MGVSRAFLGRSQSSLSSPPSPAPAYCSRSRSHARSCPFFRCLPSAAPYRSRLTQKPQAFPDFLCYRYPRLIPASVMPRWLPCWLACSLVLASGPEVVASAQHPQDVELPAACSHHFQGVLARCEHASISFKLCSGRESLGQRVLASAQHPENLELPTACLPGGLAFDRSISDQLAGEAAVLFTNSRCPARQLAY